MLRGFENCNKYCVGRKRVLYPRACSYCDLCSGLQNECLVIDVYNIADGCILVDNNSDYVGKSVEVTYVNGIRSKEYEYCISYKIGRASYCQGRRF